MVMSVGRRSIVAVLVVDVRPVC